MKVLDLIHALEQWEDNDEVELQIPDTEDDDGNLIEGYQRDVTGVEGILNTKTGKTTVRIS